MYDYDYTLWCNYTEIQLNRYFFQHATSLIGMEGGDSWGISVTGETPQVARATEEAHRTPPGKRPPAMEINSAGINLLPYF